MTPAKSDATNLTGTLEIARRGLLDLGLRNTLLNYRQRRQKGAEVIDEKPAEVFRLLDYRSLIIYTIMTSSILYFQRNTAQLLTGLTSGYSLTISIFL
jgi:hypothetical protein